MRHDTEGGGTLRLIITSFFLLVSVVVAANAQTGDQKATGTVWLDLAAGNNGGVIYPQYAWAAPVSGGTFSGYGFLESAPYERLFMNNLVTFTPTDASWFTAHGEIGGLPGHAKGLVQLGPRVNLQKIIPKLNKAASYVFVAYLPALAGIRTNNVLVAGESRQFPIVGQRFTAHIEAFDRIFANFSYGEVWFVGHVRSWKHIEPITHMIRDTSRSPVYTVAFGVRISSKP